MKGERRKLLVAEDMDENDLQKRLFRFSVDVLKLLRRLTGGVDLKIISYQLGKSATSSGANYEEAQAAVSRSDFSFKVSISLKEMRESNYWLRILNELYTDDAEIERLQIESFELKCILGSISKKVSPRA